MQNNQINNSKPTYIYALGGLEEIGKNTYVIEYDNDLIIVDIGIKFTNETFLGVNGMLANYEVLIEKQDKVKALVITHGHEDHIGAVVHLLRKIKVPKIIAPRLPVELIKKKLSEHKDIQPPELIAYDDDCTFTIGSIGIDFFRVCHSIPDSFSVCFSTPNGRIVETGDFRFDFATDGDQTDLMKLMSIGQRQIDVLLCESTSSEVPGFSESEKYIIQNIIDYIKSARGRVFVSTFASNLTRIEAIIVAAINMNKKVVILGKSMEANVKISRRLGYLKTKDSDFIQAKDIKDFPDNEILVILTGSQGEPTAALNVMAQGKHGKVSLKPGDTIILSSNPIPGNFAQVEDMINLLYRLGVIVYENTPEKKIHASGHATRSEQQLMIKGINAKYLVPIHGEYKMLRTLKKNAIDIGYNPDNVIIVRNGDVLELNNHILTVSNVRHQYEPIYINGKEVNNKTNELLHERDQISSDGIVNLVIPYNLNKKHVGNPNLSTRGCFYAKDCVHLTHKISYTIKNELTNFIKEHLDWQENALENEMKVKAIEIAKQNIWKAKKKNPVITCDVINLEVLKNDILNKNFIVPSLDNKMVTNLNDETNDEEQETD